MAVAVPKKRNRLVDVATAAAMVVVIACHRLSEVVLPRTLIYALLPALECGNVLKIIVAVAAVMIVVVTVIVAAVYHGIFCGHCRC